MTLLATVARNGGPRCHFVQTNGLSPTCPAGCRNGLLKPAGAQVQADRHKAERSNQSTGAKQGDALGRMIVGFRMVRNDRNNGHRTPRYVFALIASGQESIGSNV